MSDPVNPYYSHPRPEVQALVPTTAKTMLDIGCGGGALSEGIKQRQPCEVYGIEPVPQAAEIARSKLDHVLVGCVEEHLPQLPRHYFDCIVMADVLEHMVDPYRVLQDLKGVLKPSGQVIVSLPNIRHWSTVKMLLEGRWDYEDAGIMDRTHLRFFTRSSALQMFRNNGYEPKHLQGVVLPGAPFPPGLDQDLARHGIDARSLAQESQVYQFLIVAEPN